LNSLGKGKGKPAFGFPAEAGTHLPTPEGWKAELALGGWLVTYIHASIRVKDRPLVRVY